MVSRYANDSPLNPQQVPDNDATLPPDQSGTSSDASQRSTLGKMWDSWTSRPENNAAMINFGLQLMQPRAPGQTELGQWGRAIGAGAEALTGNVDKAAEREQAEQKMDLAERAQAVKEEEGSAYSQYMRNRNTVDKIGTQQLLKQQANWDKWKNSAEPGDDIVSGRSRDSVVNYIRQVGKDRGWDKYSKSEIMNDPGARAEAERYVKQGPSAALPTSSAPPMAPRDLEALRWAREHPDDPRAAQIIERLRAGH